MQEGSWGLPPNSLKVIQIGYNIFGVVIEDGYTAQGETTEGTSIYSFVGDEFKKIFFTETSVDRGDNFPNLPKTKWSSSIKFKKEGESFFDIVLQKEGFVDGKKINSTELYKFDGISYSKSELYE